MLWSRTAESPAPSRAAPDEDRFYHPELDGLRFLAFLAVFVHHALPVAGGSPGSLVDLWVHGVLRGGAAGVDLFFALSAFLVTELLLRERERRGRIDVGAFYVRRTLRIWPLYYGFLAFCVWFEPHVVGNDGLRPEYAWPFAAFVGNWAIAWHDALPNSSALILWSVSMEEQFYLAWPILLRACRTRTRVVLLSLVLLVVANVARCVLGEAGLSASRLSAISFTRMDAFAAGALLAGCLGGGAPRFAARKRWLLFASGGVLIVAASVYFEVQPVVARPERMLYPLRTLGVAAILVATLQPVGTARGLLATPAVVYLGRISYGLYVFHLLVVLLVFQLPETFLYRYGFLGAAATVLGVSLSATIALAAVSYHFLERPFLSWKERFARVASRPGG